MQPEEFGFDPNHKATDGAPFVSTGSSPIPAYMEFQDHKYRLSSKLFHRPTIVSRGTLYWLAEDEEGNKCVVKDTWGSKYRTSEDQLRKAMEQNV